MHDYWIDFQAWKAEMVLKYNSTIANKTGNANNPVPKNTEMSTPDTDTEEKLELFRTFLIQYGLLERVTEIIATRRNETLEEFCTVKSLLGFIDTMACWSQLREGHVYWSDINQSWIEYVNATKYGIMRQMVIGRSR